MSDNKQKNETVDDVLAEMLERADVMQTHGTTHGVRLAIREFARRIKSAWKRERAKVEADALEVGGIVEAARTAEKSSAVDNAAAMRDALVQCELFIGNVSRNGHPAFCFGDQCTACNGVDELREMVIRALSSPTRNCDLYDDAKTAWWAWIEDADNWDEFGSPKLELLEWLFASANKKGENDGIK